MNLLLDTHAFIWWDSEPAKLSAQVLALCHDSRNTSRVMTGFDGARQEAAISFAC
jgi:PIN domain nuclease of toxin-antitoxin system